MNLGCWKSLFGNLLLFTHSQILFGAISLKVIQLHRYIGLSPVTLLGHLSLQIKLLYLFQVFIHSSDTDGRALLGRFQTKTQDLQSDDQEVKVQVYINQFFFLRMP